MLVVASEVGSGRELELTWDLLRTAVGSIRLVLIDSRVREGSGWNGVDRSLVLE